MKKPLLSTFLSLSFYLFLGNQLLAAPVTLPIGAIEAGGASWTYLYSDSSYGFNISEANFMGLGDSYDGMFGFRINGTIFDVGSSVDSSDFSIDYTTLGKRITSDQIDLGGDLSAQQQYLFFNNPVNGLPTVRSLLKITNNGVARTKMLRS